MHSEICLICPHGTNANQPRSRSTGYEFFAVIDYLEKGFNYNRTMNSLYNVHQCKLLHATNSKHPGQTDYYK